MSSPVSTHLRQSEKALPPALAEPKGASDASVAHAAITKTDLAVNRVMANPSLFERPSLQKSV
jgi:hypothetical protein